MADIIAMEDLTVVQFRIAMIANVNTIKSEQKKLKEKRRKAYEKDIRDNAIDDFSRMMKNANLINAFVLYQADEIDLSEFIELASDEIANRLKGVTL